MAIAQVLRLSTFYILLNYKKISINLFKKCIKLFFLFYFIDKNLVFVRRSERGPAVPAVGPVGAGPQVATTPGPPSAGYLEKNSLKIELKLKKLELKEKFKKKII
jgi:hypothetical protein